MLRKIRIGFWLGLLFVVLFQLWEEYQALQWRKPLYVAVYPINADGTMASASYINSLKESDFTVVEDFFSAQALHYHVYIRRPIKIKLGPLVEEVPLPPPPVESGLLEIMHWSLNFRLYAMRNKPEIGVPVDIKLYLLYYDANQNRRLLHSTALNKGRIGRVNLFAAKDQHAGNMVVIAHELLHTINATDKYDMQTGEPLFPQGYAEPYAQPVYPQSMAEIMAGRIPLNDRFSKMAPGLEHVVVGRQTAREIGWLK